MLNVRLNLKIIFLVILLFILSGCKNEVNTTTITETTESLPVITKYKDLNAVDLSPEYIIEADKLTTYHYHDHQITYVNILEFITFMKGAIIDLTITKDDMLTISHTMNVPNEFRDIYGGPTYTYEMTIDAHTDTILYNDFDMINILNLNPLTEYETEVILSDYEIYDEGDLSVEIDLSLYDIDIILYENEYYMPLYLANLFFTGDAINVYEMNNDIFILDYLSNLSMLEDLYKKNHELEASNITIHTKNYLALYFDYFYGLKEYKNIESYKTVLDNDYNFETFDDFDSIHKEVKKFMTDLNDLHTSVITYGYMDPNFHPNNLRSSKMNRYIYAYNKNECYIRDKEIDYTIFEDTVILQINAFSLETKDLLNPIIEQIRDYENIVIDISCNPGGNVYGVIELLSYMTDEDIPVSYINPKTGSKIIEYYDTSNTEYLDKNYYIYTTAATYSAANLFASIVKDQGLGFIIGEKSGGGASAITNTVLPDGALIVNSSNLTFINKNDEIIEDGIDVDFHYNNPYKFFDSGLFLDTIFQDFSDVSIDKLNQDDSYSYQFNIDKNSLFTINKYKLSVYDYDTNELLYQEEFTQDDFQFIVNKPLDNLIYKIQVSVEFQLNGTNNEELIYSDIIDDHGDSFEYASNIPIDQVITSHRYLNRDKDVYKFSIIEGGTYTIEIDDDIRSMDIYNDKGDLITHDYVFLLEPGTYYIQVSRFEVGYYNIQIKTLEDDNTGTTIITLQDGVQHHQLFYDFLYDEETFEFILNEDSVVTFSWNVEDYSKYSIIKTNGYPYQGCKRLSTNENLRIFLPKGTYFVSLNSHPPYEEVSLTTTLTTDFHDYSGDISSIKNNYGELQFGLNSVTFIAQYDIDVYYIDIIESSSYIFNYDDTYRDVYYKNFQKDYREKLSPNEILCLKPGRYYFIFESKDLDNDQYPTTTDITFTQVHDENNENNMSIIEINQEITTTLSYPLDSDYFEFYSSERNTYQLDINGGDVRYCTIIDSMNNEIVVYDCSEDTFHFTVNEGHYILKIEASSHIQYIREINFLIKDSPLKVEAPNKIDLPLGYYDIVNLDSVTTIKGAIDYREDRDIFILNVETSGYYRLNLNDPFIPVSVNIKGEFEIWRNDSTKYFEAGKYYLKISENDKIDYIIILEIIPN